MAKKTHNGPIWRSDSDNRSKPDNRNERREVFAEVSLFDTGIADSNENGDCGCFTTCDGNPCLK